MRTIVLLLLGLLAAVPSVAQHRSHSGNSRSRPRASVRAPRTSRRSDAAPGVARDSRGRVERSEQAKREFMKGTGYPHGRKGYVVDHIKPLACGGADDPSNMQWQSVGDAKVKDRVERQGCTRKP